MVGPKLIEDIDKTVKELELMPAVEREIVNSLWNALSGLREYFTQISFTMSNYDQWFFKQVCFILP